MTRTVRVLGKIALAALAGAAVGRAGRSAHLLPAGGWGPFPPAMLVSAALWVGFSIYWSIAATNRAPSRSGESIVSRQFHVIAVNVALVVLLVPIPGLIRRIVADTIALHILGLTVQAAFIGLAIWARRHLGSNWSGEVRIAHTHELVRSGPYRYVRHPIYTALSGCTSARRWCLARYTRWPRWASCCWRIGGRSGSRSRRSRRHSRVTTSGTAATRGRGFPASTDEWARCLSPVPLCESGDTK